MATVNSNPQAQRIIATNELVTGPPAAEMLRRSLKDVSNPLEVMDNACGGGVVTADLFKLAGEQQHMVKIQRIVAADIDENMIDYVKNRKADSGWQNVELVKTDQQSVALPDNSFTHVFNNFGIFFCPNDKAALAETLRITKAGGIAAFTTWKSIAWWPSFAVPALSTYLPDAPPLPVPDTIFLAQGWNDPASIHARMEAAGFQDVQISEFGFTPDVPAEQFAEACAALTKGMARRFWSKDENEKYADGVQPAFLKFLLENFPDGKWNGTMVAIISIGTKV